MAGSAPWIQLFLDVPRKGWERSVDFWAAATGWSPSAPRGEAGQFATLLAADGAGWVKLQAVDGPPRVHLDLDEPDRAAAVERSRSLGAQPQWEYEGVPVMRSPGGLFFCHTVEAPGRIDRSDPLRVLDQVCIDIPADRWESETAFWAELLQRPLTKGRNPEFAYLDGGPALRVLLQRLDDESGEVRAHPDFAVADPRRGDPTARRARRQGRGCLPVVDRPARARRARLLPHRARPSEGTGATSAVVLTSRSLDGPGGG